MTNKIIIVGVIGVLVVGLVLLGFEVKNLRREVVQLSRRPIASAVALRQQPMARSRQPQPRQMQPKQTQPRQAQSKQMRPQDPRMSFYSQWDPYAEITQVQNQMRQLLDEESQGGLWYQELPSGNSYTLNSDVKDDKDKYIINVDIPGMEKENINVEVRSNTLIVSGERNNAKEQEDANYYKQERSFGYFSQAFPLPDDADASGIFVEYKKGVLTIEIPKLEKSNIPQEQSKKITVQ
ncbi:MAG: Hsp20/alpha crystallin family protein [Candidatus Aceula meridiana]|nr:Hsp20/alpha crystallin family protein [Candidatus Aceula meridiana]